MSRHDNLPPVWVKASELMPRGCNLADPIPVVLADGKQTFAWLRQGKFCNIANNPFGEFLLKDKAVIMWFPLPEVPK